MNEEKSEFIFPAWYGELGWEVMSWVPFCRKRAAGFDRVVARSFADMAPLYEDFATEFQAHNEENRSLDYPKIYRPDGVYHRYGRPQDAQMCSDVLIHARGIRRKSSINYRRWSELIDEVKKLAVSFAFIGTKIDECVFGCFDWRDIELQRLMNIIARSKLVIGCSSGLMHLAAACGTNLVVWGDSRTYFGETLEQRYKVTWNPFEVRVGWITADDWQPEPKTIVEKIERIL